MDVCFVMVHVSFLGVFDQWVAVNAAIHIAWVRALHGTSVVYIFSIFVSTLGKDNQKPDIMKNEGPVLLKTKVKFCGGCQSPPCCIP